MRIFETPLAPQSGFGRVLVCVLVAIFATLALLAWSPANACDFVRAQPTVIALAASAVERESPGATTPHPSALRSPG